MAVNGYITYHPVNDPYHCMFRSLLLLRSVDQAEYEVDKFRILDFYFLFPYFLKRLQKPRPDVTGAYALSGLASTPKPFQRLPKPAPLFRQIEGVQRAAFQQLASTGLVDRARFADGVLKKTKRDVSEALAIELDAARQEQQALLQFLLESVSLIPLYGSGGLKARSGLMEYRYDAI